MLKILIVTALSSLASNPLWAQAGDQPFEDLGVISLPGDLPSEPGMRLNWDCDVLLPSTDARYRPGACGKTPHLEDAQEIPLEKVNLESADNKTKSRGLFQY